MPGLWVPFARSGKVESEVGSGAGVEVRGHHHGGTWQIILENYFSKFPRL